MVAQINLSFLGIQTTNDDGFGFPLNLPFTSLFFFFIGNVVIGQKC